jgi:hypothetical protein
MAVDPAPTPIRWNWLVFMPFLAARNWVRVSVPDPRSVTPRVFPLKSVAEWTPDLVVHISRSPGAPESWTTSSTALPFAWNSIVWLYQAPAMSTWPEAMASSAPTPPSCSVLNCTLTPYFL